MEGLLPQGYYLPASPGSMDRCLPLTPFAPCMLSFGALTISPLAVLSLGISLHASSARLFPLP